MSDLIKREDAIRAIKQWRDNDGSLFDVGLNQAIREIKRLPSADRPQGEWRKHDDERDYCSRCKHIFKTRIITPQDKWTVYIDDLGYNYCPNCGADMRKGVDDE